MVRDRTGHHTRLHEAIEEFHFPKPPVEPVAELLKVAVRLDPAHPPGHVLDVPLQVAQDGVDPMEGRYLGTLPPAWRLLGIVLVVLF